MKLNQLLSLDWYEIRDLLFGHNYVKQDLKRAFALAAICDHPEARWLNGMIADNNIDSMEQLRTIFVRCEKNDLKALCFSALSVWPVDKQALQRSADGGFGFAQACIAERKRGEDSFHYALLAAFDRERDGFFWLGECFRNGFGCEKDAVLSRENFMNAAVLGHVDAMVEFGKSFDWADPRRWYWWAKAASKGQTKFFFDYFCMKKASSPCHNVMIAVGQALKEHVDKEKGQIFGSTYLFDSHSDEANQAIDVFKTHCALIARNAIHSWSLIGLRNGVCKDIRIMIARIVWDRREDLNMSFELSES